MGAIGIVFSHTVLWSILLIRNITKSGNVIPSALSRNDNINLIRITQPKEKKSCSERAARTLVSLSSRSRDRLQESSVCSIMRPLDPGPSSKIATVD